MTACPCKTLLISGAAALALGALAMPASATTQDNLESCKAQLVLDGHVTDATKRVSFEKASRRTVTLNIENHDGSEREAVCRISRGKVASLEIQGEPMLAKVDVKTDRAQN